MTIAPKSTRRQTLMAKAEGKVSLVPMPPLWPETQGDPPSSLAQFLLIERARERQRNAARLQNSIRIG